MYILRLTNVNSAWACTAQETTLTIYNLTVEPKSMNENTIF